MTNNPEDDNPERIKATQTYKNSLLMRLTGAIWTKLYGSAPDATQKFFQDRKNRSEKFIEALKHLGSAETALEYAKQLGIEDGILKQIHEEAFDDASHLREIHTADSPEALGRIVTNLAKKKPTN